jgi:hypothetical protein
MSIYWKGSTEYLQNWGEYSKYVGIRIRQGPILLVYFVESIAIPRASRTRFALRSVAVIFCDFKHGNHSPTRSWAVAKKC